MLQTIVEQHLKETGRGFDLPVIGYRAMLHELAAGLDGWPGWGLGTGDG